MAQFAIEDSDEAGDKVDLHHEPAFERDVLLNFLLGLKPDLQVEMFKEYIYNQDIPTTT